MPCCFQGQSEEGCISEECGLLLLMEEIVHQLIGSLSYCLRGFLHPKWCKIFSINSIIFFSGGELSVQWGLATVCLNIAMSCFVKQLMLRHFSFFIGCCRYFCIISRAKPVLFHIIIFCDFLVGP